MTWLLVAVGGALGATARFAVAEGLLRVGVDTPVPTLVVNVLGSAVLGALIVALGVEGEGHRLRLLAGIGFLGSFTTFSTFSVEIVRLQADTGWMRAGLYAGGSVVLGVAAALAGMWLAGAGRPS